MNSWLYAYRQTDDQVDLWISEAGKLPPNGYTICSRDGFSAAWRRRDQIRKERLREAAERMAAPAPTATRSRKGERGE